MTWDDAFGLSNSLALAGWLLLALAPRRRPVLAVTGLLLPALLALPYALLMMQHFAAAGGGFGSIAEVRTLLAADPVLLAGWQHYLAHDLLVGTLVARRLDAAGIGRVLQWPILAAGFLFGPAGLLLGLALEGGTRALDRLGHRARHRAALPRNVLPGAA